MFGCCKIDTAVVDAPTDLCPLHPSLPIEKVCIQNRCLEPLCHLCEAQHLKIHQMLSTQPKLMNSQIVKHYALQQCQREIRSLQKSSNFAFNKSPKEQIFQMVDEFFYGPATSRLLLLKKRQRSVIAILLDEHKYIVPKNFQNILSLFLDKNLMFHNI